MVPQEIQNSNDVSQTKEVVKEINSPKEKLQKIFETSTLKPETIENLKKILALVDINDLKDFIISEPDLDDVINKWKEIDLSLSIEWVVDNFLMKFENQDKLKNNQEKINTINNEKKLDTKLIETNKEQKENNLDSKTKALETLKQNSAKYKKIFWADSEFFNIFQRNENNPDILAKELETFLNNPENRKAVFDKIAATGDAKLYQETYKALSSFHPLSDISPTIYKVEKLDWGKIEDKTIISQFPWANPKDIEKRWDLVSYGDKTIDLKTGKAFISGEGWYAIETSMKVPNSLDLRVSYQKERLEILEGIKTNEKILNLVENKEELKRNLEELKKQKSTDSKNAQDLQLDIEITAIEKELQKIDEKLKQAVPWYKEEDDKNLKIFLKEKIEESKASLKSLKEKFDTDMQKLLEAGQGEIKARDEKVRETISFLDDLWITNINQHDLQKIITRINIHPQAYGFSKPIDLTKGFEGSATESHKQKKEFFNFFSKMYEKMWLTNPPISHSVIEGINKDPRLKNDTTFKQQLEDTGVTLGWALQIETFFTLIKEEPKKEQTQKQEN